MSFACEPIADWVANRRRLRQFVSAVIVTVLFAILGSRPSVARDHHGSTAVAAWDFGAEESTPLVAHGKVQRDQAGPRPPEFPDLAVDNTAVRVDPDGYLSVPDQGPDSDFDFTNGDAITIEAWVNPIRIGNGQLHYVVGKGRTGSPMFARDNQNWALRIAGADGQARLSFLFATRRSTGDQHWHRWTSTAGFPVATGWHHVAVAYRFGEPDSMRGWINGQPTTGAWDMGGSTTEPPIVDDDEIRIGNRFDGLLDAVAIHRELLGDDVMAARFSRVGDQRILKLQPERMPDLGELPDGQVLFQLCEKLPTAKRWLYEGEQWPAESIRWLGDSFLLPRIPLQFDSWGIRAGWNAPLLLRVAGDVELPTGTQQFLFRARALGRMWIDGERVASTKPITHTPPNGEEPVTPVAEPPIPGARAQGYHQQEVIGEVTIEAGDDSATRRCRIVLEVVVGGGNHRTETGEICAAILAADGQSYQVLSPNACRLPLTDAAVKPALDRVERSLAELDDRRRRAAAASQDEFWNMRHQRARRWASARRASEIRQLGSGRERSIDAMIESKIQRALAAASRSDLAEADHFHSNVLPILRENCFRCHDKQANGGLRLDSRAAALRGGDSEMPAVVAGDPQASEMIARIRSDDAELRMPPTDDGLTGQQIESLESWIRSGAPWPEPPLNASAVALSPTIGDDAFLRRVYLDTIGLPPTASESSLFLSDRRPDKRERLIDQLLADERTADHWVSYWLDVLAENPSLLNASLNSTGPFRWFLYDSLRDNKPLDRLVTELLMMRGGAAEGGSAGFAIAAENDAPLAAKGHIIASAFLGIELQCARCHDSPYHATTQRDLYSLAAMLNRKPVTVPATSRVPAAFFEQQTSRESLIQVSLKIDQQVQPRWPFAAVTGVEDGAELDQLMQRPDDTRERLAALITAPQNEQFPRVVVNRIWKRLIGTGFVEPIHDWEGSVASHPELLDWLAWELVEHNYDVRQIIRLILLSDTYQRAATGSNHNTTAALRFFNAPDPRRLTAEQVVDSLHQVTGQPIDVEELTFVHDGRRPLSGRQTLGRPARAWMFADLKNERDRPSLSLPKARAVVDVLEAFGWSGARQMPIHQRESDPNVLQPGVLANGTLSLTLTRAAVDSELADLAVAAESPASLVATLFRRFLGRAAKPDELQEFSTALADGFGERLVPANEIVPAAPPAPLPLVTWFNHQRAEANRIQLEIERRVQAGPTPDPRLRAAWRDVYEDAVWSLVNHREFVWMP